MSETAENALREVGLKVTANRLQVLEILAETSAPLSVREIQNQMRSDCDESTVFRTLSTFESKQLVEVALVSDRQKLYSFASKHHSHYVICRECGSVEEINLCGISHLLSKAKELGFSDLKHRIEISGLCRSCVA